MNLLKRLVMGVGEPVTLELLIQAAMIKRLRALEPQKYWDRL